MPINTAPFSLWSWSAQGRCPPCPRTAIWCPAGGQATQTHTGHQLFSIIASQWIKLINIQTRWLWMLHPCAAAGCECVQSSSLDIGSVHMISSCSCYTVGSCIVSCFCISSLQFILLVGGGDIAFMNILNDCTFSFFYYKHVDILIVCCIYVAHLSFNHSFPAQ